MSGKVQIDTVEESRQSLIDAGQVLGEVIKRLNLKDAVLANTLRLSIEGLVYAAVHLEAEQQAEHWGTKHNELRAEVTRLQELAKELA